MTSAETAEHRHDLVNALTAIEGAATILTADDLSATDRATLGRLLTSGVDRLRALVEDWAARTGPVRLAHAAREVAVEPRWHGRVLVDVATDLMASGRADGVADALRHLLSSAGEQAPATVLTLRGCRYGETVGLWLQVGDDRPMAPDLAAGFDVAARMGERHVAVVGDGGRSIGICLPAASEEAGAEHAGA